MDNKTIRCSFCSKNRDESHKMLVSKSGSTDPKKQVVICDNCVMLFSNLLEPKDKKQAPEKAKKSLAAQLNSLKIREFLDQYAIGQESAKMALCVSVVNHYKRMLYAAAESVGDLSKSNLLITGPSGSGKSLLVSTVAKFLDVPFIAIDATTLTEAGYVGQNVDTIISRLLIEAQGDLDKVENGIVFIDEIDKISTGKARGSYQESKVSGVQSALLKMIEGCVVPVQLGGGMGRMPTRTVEVNTSNILFIVGGAFTGLNEIVTRRLKKKVGIGFNMETAKQLSLEAEYTTEDFVEYGLIPEFIGRFPLKTHTKELSEDELRKVLSNVKNNVLNEYKFYFSIDKIDLTFTQDFVTAVAIKAQKEKTGVRGLRTICDNLMMPHLYLLPEYQKRGVAKMTFTGENLDPKKIPTIEIYEKAPKVKREKPLDKAVKKVSN